MIQSLMSTIPEHIIDGIQDWLWGGRDEWHRRFGECLRQMCCSTRAVHALRDVAVYQLMARAVDSEDCLYCDRCGEKRLWFPFALSTDQPWCEPCTEPPETLD